MKRLSVIIPMYNVAPYVERCIRSLEDQDVPQEDYELICINDGSPDHSKEVVRTLQNEFSNIVLIDQENQGVSVARNNGIDRATGDYLLMIDPDDYVLPNVFAEKLKILDQSKVDIGYTGYVILDGQLKEEYRYDPIYKEDKVISGIQYFNRYEKGKVEIRDPHRSVAIFFRRSFFNQHTIRYLSEVPYLEDGELITRAACLAQRVIFINTPFYMRTTRPGSATHSNLFNTDRARTGFLKAANNLHIFKLNKCIETGQKEFVNQSIIHFTFMFLVSVKIKEYIKYYPQLHASLKTGSLRKLDNAGCSRFYTKIARYYNLSIHFVYLYWVLFSIRHSLKFKAEKLFKSV
ncbi:MULTISPECIES: glycosyltransferase family 2 protein [unclassified Carboxylicivirga]|uniref:glycosyltransferase family 2 protein n=1 Tax=Carboxylicivirga TaxID=1628153 RepID=UPI003D33892B